MVPKVVGSNPIFHPKNKRSKKVSVTTPFVFLHYGVNSFANIVQKKTNELMLQLFALCSSLVAPPAACRRERRKAEHPQDAQ